MPGCVGDLGEGMAGKHIRGGTRDEKTPLGLTGTWVQSEGRKGGSAPSQETAEDSGTRCRSQGRAAEAGGWRGRTALCTRREGGERVKNKRYLTRNGYGWGGGRKEGKRTI